jgi:hypothetical protein
MISEREPKGGDVHRNTLYRTIFRPRRHAAGIPGLSSVAITEPRFGSASARRLCEDGSYE